MIVIIIILTVLIVAAITIGLVFGLKKSNKSGPGSVNPSPPTPPHSGSTPPHSGPTPPPSTQSPYGPTSCDGSSCGDLGTSCQKDSDCVLSGFDIFCNSQTNRCELRECPSDMKDWDDCGTFTDEETCKNGYSNDTTTNSIGAAPCSNTVPCYKVTGKVKCNWAGTYCTESKSDTICAKTVTRS